MDFFLIFSVLLLAAAAVGFLVVLHLWFWSLYYRPDESGVDEVHYARTPDGWRLALHRYRGGGERTRQPVVMCHGLAANRFTFDLGEQQSLARYLRRLGWDVWVVELRGTGSSTRPIPLGGRRWSWTFEDHLHQDIPTILDYICENTRAPAVHWVGHSMGGILMYAWLQTVGALQVRSCTTIGSPAFYESNDTLNLVTRLQRLAGFSLFPVLRFRFLMRLMAPFYVPLRIGLIGANGANVDGTVMRRVMTHMVSDICSNVLREMAEWIKTGTFGHGDVDYQSGISSIRTPMLVMTGDADVLCPPGETRRIVEALSSEERQFQVLGKRFGTGEDYGHGDLLFGRDARREVYPLVAEWLEERSHDALPPPVPDTTVEVEPEPKPARQVPVRPVPSALPGPFGLLNRFSPARRRRWLEERKRFRLAEANLWDQLEAGLDPSESRLSFRGARARRTPDLPPFKSRAASSAEDSDKRWKDAAVPQDLDESAEPEAKKSAEAPDENPEAIDEDAEAINESAESDGQKAEAASEHAESDDESADADDEADDGEVSQKSGQKSTDDESP